MKVSIDSRTVQPGDIFIPVKGPNFDGRDFIHAAVSKGARVLDVDLTAYAKKYRKKLNCQIIAVTGSSGKTTVKDLLYSVLSEKYKTVKTVENQNNEVGVPLSILAAEHDTEILILEMAMRNKGDIAHLSKIARPTHAVVTSTGLTHIENLKTPRKIAEVKAEIFQPALKWERKKRIAFINKTSKFYDLLEEKAVAREYSILPFEGETLWDQNLNLCYSIGHHFGLSDADIEKGLQSYESSSHRLKKLSVGGLTVIDDAYNANPDGVKYSVEYLRRTQGRKILVLGDMLELGSYSEGEHKKVADWCLDAGVSIIYTFGELSSVIESDEIPVYHFNKKKELHKHLLMELKSGDNILVKGSRGMKMEETVRSIQEHYGA